MYVSDFTRFLQDLHEKNPQLAADQRASRAIWWDKKPQTDEERANLALSRVPQPGYVYQTKL